MAHLLWSGKLSIPVKIAVNLNCLLAYLTGNARNGPAMKHRIKLGYSQAVTPHSASYDDVGLSHYNRVAHKLLDGVSVMGKSVLDVGCGTGILSLAAFERGASRVVGVDLSRTMVEECRKKVSEIGLDRDTVEFRQGDAECLKFSDESFDVVSSSLSLGFVPDQDKAIREMARVAKAGGDVIIATHGPRHYWEACDLAFKSIGKRHVMGYRLEFWPRKESEIRRLMKSAGLTNIRIGNFVWQEEVESGDKLFDFFAGTSGMWWYSKFPAHKRERDSSRMRRYFSHRGTDIITFDVILAYARRSK